MKGSTKTLLAVWGLAVGLGFSACQSGASTTDTPTTDSVLVAEPIGETNETVNKMADNLFNKPVTESQVAQVALPATNLAPNAAPLPELMDATLSRESIVVFSQKIMTEMPDEIEFVQERSEHFAGPNGWNAFRVQYSTRPGKIGMVIYGAYQQADQALWASEVSSGLRIAQLLAVEPAEGGVTIYGKYSDESPFSATLTASGVALKRVATKGA